MTKERRRLASSLSFDDHSFVGFWRNTHRKKRSFAWHKKICALEVALEQLPGAIKLTVGVVLVSAEHTASRRTSLIYTVSASVSVGYFPENLILRQASPPSPPFVPTGSDKSVTSVRRSTATARAQLRFAADGGCTERVALIDRSGQLAHTVRMQRHLVVSRLNGGSLFCSWL